MGHHCQLLIRSLLAAACRRRDCSHSLLCCCICSHIYMQSCRARRAHALQVTRHAVAAQRAAHFQQPDARELLREAALQFHSHTRHSHGRPHVVNMLMTVSPAQVGHVC